MSAGFGPALRPFIAWVRAAHPYPIAMVLTLTALVGLASSRGQADGLRLTAAVAAMLLSQLAIGWTNDYIDRDRDAVSQQWKPVPAGELDAGQLPVAAAFTAATGTALAALLGPWTLVFFVFGTAAGLSYDLWFKNTPLSWAPYVVGFAVLPPFVWSALDSFRDQLLALYLVATPLVPAVHLAQSLPDAAADAASGGRGLAAGLGDTAGGRLLALCLALPPLLTAASLLWIDYDLPLLAASICVYTVLLAAAARLYQTPAGRRAAFRPIALASVLFSAGWLAAV